jgi:2-dehydro-3-deoxyphosphogluconate aldolase/(4S)-4-hydroxy-2-oxoglutarate aldolase
MNGTIDQLAAQGVLPVLRCATVKDAIDTARACAGAGLRAIELTRTTPHVERALQALRGDGLLLGLGTITHRDQILPAVRAGAAFVVSFAAPDGLVETAHEHATTAIPGASTPTEILSCLDRGADAVKLFPARNHTPAYLRDLHAVMPTMRAIVTGGLSATADSAGAWLAAGALAVGHGSELGSVAQHGAPEVQRRAGAALSVAATAIGRRSAS